MTKLTELVERVERDGGFQLYAHATGRGDINDGFYGDRDSYVRAAHNIKLLNPYVVFELNIDGMIRRMAEICKDSEFVAYGTLTKRVLKKTGGIFGIGKKDSWTSKAYKSNELLNNSQNNDAHYVRLSVNASIADGIGRSGQNYPSLIVVADKNLIGPVVNHLREKPNDYSSLVRGLVSRGRFPKSNAGLLDIMNAPKSMIFVDQDAMALDTNRNPGYLLRKYGERVEL